MCIYPVDSTAKNLWPAFPLKRIGHMQDDNQLMRRPEVERVTGFRRSQLYLLMSRGEFPRPVRIGERAVAWRASDVRLWIESREAV